MASVPEPVPIAASASVSELVIEVADNDNDNDDDNNSELTELTRCPQCKESYVQIEEEYSSLRVPKLLHCLHSLCKGCAIHLAVLSSTQDCASGASGASGASAAIACPTCAARTFLPAADTTCNSLTADFTVNHLLCGSRLPLCGLCEDGVNTTATWGCADCTSESSGSSSGGGSTCDNTDDAGVFGVPMCDACKDTHGKFRAFRAHAVLPLREFEALRRKRRAANVVIRCTAHHSHPLEFHCATCQRNICARCFDEAHAGHLIIALQDLAAKERRSLQDLCDRLLLRHQDLSAVESQLKQRRTEFGQSLIALHTAMDQELALFIEALKRRVEAAHIDVSRQAKLVEERFDAALALQQSKAAQLQLHARRMQLGLKHGADGDVLRSAKLFVGHLEAELSALAGLNPLPQFDMSNANVTSLPSLATTNANNSNNCTAFVGPNLLGVVPFSSRLLRNLRATLGPENPPTVPGSNVNLAIISCERNVHENTVRSHLASLPMPLAQRGNNSSSHVRLKLPVSVTEGSFGGPTKQRSSAVGAFSHPWGVAVQLPLSSKVRPPQPASAADLHELPQQTIVFVADRNNHRIQAFDAATGLCLRVIGHGPGRGKGELDGPCGLVLLDTRIVDNFTRYNSNQSDNGDNGEETSVLPNPPNAGDAPLLFVADSNNARVQVFNSLTGENVLTIPGDTLQCRELSADGEPLLVAPWGLALQRDAFEIITSSGDSDANQTHPMAQLRDLLFVSDRRRSHIAVFDAQTGVPIRRIDLDPIAALTLTPTAFLSPKKYGPVSPRGYNSNFTTTVPSTAPLVDGMCCGCGLALLPPLQGGLEGDTLLFVAEFSHGRIGVFNARTGRRLRTVNVQGNGLSLHSPAGLALWCETTATALYGNDETISKPEKMGFFRELGQSLNLESVGETKATSDVSTAMVESTRKVHMFVGDFQSNRVLVLDAATGKPINGHGHKTVSEVIPESDIGCDGTASVLTAAGPASMAVASIDATHKMLFIAEWAGHQVRKVKL